jgi:hypothetical protein
MANAAIEKRRTNMEARGLDPGPNQGPEISTSRRIEQPTLYGTFVAYTGQDEAWFYPDVESLARFRSSPGQ